MNFASFLPRALVAAFMLLSLGSISGCGSSGEFADLQAQMAEIKARPRGRIEAPPEFVPIATVSYASHQSRSPFRPPSGQEELELLERRSVEPDFTRPKEYLERFTLDSLAMVGTITKPESPLEALLRDPTGAVNRVRVGNYMGKNFGRVVEVTEGSVSVIEIVPDGQDGWVERPRTIRVDE